MFDDLNEENCVFYVDDIKKVFKENMFYLFFY